jgi:hypothetical protein
VWCGRHCTGHVLWADNIHIKMQIPCIRFVSTRRKQGPCRTAVAIDLFGVKPGDGMDIECGAFFGIKIIGTDKRGGFRANRLRWSGSLAPIV